MSKIKIPKKKLKTLSLCFHIGISHADTDEEALDILKLRNSIFKKNNKWRKKNYK